WQERAGLAVERLLAEDARLLEPRISPRVRMALLFPLDWQVENRRLVAALASAVETYGVRVWPGTEVAGVRVEAGRVAGVETSRGFLGTGVVVVAAGAWSSLIPFSAAPGSSVEVDNGDGSARATPEHPRVEPVRGQMLCFAARPTIVRHVVYTPRGYLVPRRDGRLLAGSTTERAGFDRFVTAGGVRTIAAHAIEIAPAVGGLELVDAWAGLRPCARDEWPVMGESDETRGLYYAAGLYRNGILLAPLTGQLLADAVVNHARPPALEFFAPERFRHAAVTCAQGE
ncbi:MAG: NAD(P)/FAD-dependent oxidoreductase, partial [Pyrinomonadaceae bacterium]